MKASLRFFPVVDCTQACINWTFTALSAIAVSCLSIWAHTGWPHMRKQSSCWNQRAVFSFCWFRGFLVWFGFPSFSFLQERSARKLLVRHSFLLSHIGLNFYLLSLPPLGQAAAYHLGRRKLLRTSMKDVLITGTPHPSSFFPFLSTVELSRSPSLKRYYLFQGLDCCCCCSWSFSFFLSTAAATVCEISPPLSSSPTPQRHCV